MTQTSFRKITKENWVCNSMIFKGSPSSFIPCHFPILGLRPHIQNGGAKVIGYPRV